MKTAYVFFLCCALLLFALTLTAPYLAYTGHEELSEFNYVLFADTCHQRANRSFFVFNHKMGVCARCFGVYAGILAGTLLYPVLWGRNDMPPGWVVLAAAAPLVLDGGTQLLGLRESDNTLRLATGLFFGAAVPYYLIPALELILEEVRCFFIRRLR